MRSEPLSPRVLHGSCTCEGSTTRIARPMMLTGAQESETVSPLEAILIRRMRTGMTRVMIRRACTVEEAADLLDVRRLVRECLTDLSGRCGQAAEDGRASQRGLRRGVGVAGAAADPCWERGHLMRRRPRVFVHDRPIDEREEGP